MRLRTLLPLAATLLAAPAAADPVVVELFTSQGCSSCPPADEMLGQLAQHEDVIALSLHVDYWDWIGWADTFAAPEFTARQRAYATAAKSEVVYTPQFVVGGRDSLAGAKGLQLSELIAAHRDANGDVLRIASTGTGRQVMADATVLDAPARLMLVTVLPEAEVRILHGENAGRDVTYHNVVRAWQDLAQWSGEDLTLDLPDMPDGLVHFVLAQAMPDGLPGPILGAVRVD
ncbi:DUF1223 domain-containing protein [Jannaschia ovalis]|uniref:DUF1223 domain-containing protein n=1 Tax=Jannaschia ovalis TaxID=3038773 RepID=A0ABY8LFK3_9RHOB|nr:DUF1223 domain-containing protein [Jannaschia sp. GRR-S6-38]WGH78944.1 DUF1223 domain-containing protein [Jannaschia sp. GRR-S6-38]